MLLNLFHDGSDATGFQKFNLPGLGALILRKYKNLKKYAPVQLPEQEVVILQQLGVKPPT